VNTSEKIVRFLVNRPEQTFRQLEISQAIGLKKTPYFGDLLFDLVDRGVIVRELGSWRGFACYYYSTSPERVQPFVLLPVEDYFREELNRASED